MKSGMNAIACSPVTKKGSKLVGGKSVSKKK